MLAFDFRGYCPGGKGDCSAGRDAMKFPLDCAAAPCLTAERFVLDSKGAPVVQAQAGLEVFLDAFPDVTKDQAVAALHYVPRRR